MRRAASAVVLVALLALAGCADERPVRPRDISVPDGFKIEAVIEDLAAPTMVAFDDQGRMLIAESGYHGGGDSRVTRLEADGRRTVLADGDDFGDEIPLTAVAFHEGRVYAAHAGSISAIEPDGTVRPLITGLPGQGDHQANQIVFKDGFMYFGMGTVTNSRRRSRRRGVRLARRRRASRAARRPVPGRRAQRCGVRLGEPAGRRPRAAADLCVLSLRRRPPRSHRARGPEVQRCRPAGPSGRLEPRVKLAPFFAGTGVLVVLTVASGVVFTLLLRTVSRARTVVAGALFGLTVWALLQYFLLPAVQPLVTEKGFTPQWYAASFGVFGLALGLLLSLGGERDSGRGSAPAAAAPPGRTGRPVPPRQSEAERMEEWRRRRAAGR